MKLRWPWRAREDTTEDAQDALRELEQREDEVQRLGRRLREAQSRNHFSTMVNEAIARTREPHK